MAMQSLIKTFDFTLYQDPAAFFKYANLQMYKYSSIFYKSGLDFYTYAALRELNSASMTLRESKISAPVVIRMGLVSGTLGGIVAKEIAQYIQNNQRLRFQLTESSAEELMDLVRQ